MEHRYILTLVAIDELVQKTKFKKSRRSRRYPYTLLPTPLQSAGVYLIGGRFRFRFCFYTRDG